MVDNWGNVLYTLCDKQGGRVMAKKYSNLKKSVDIANVADMDLRLKSFIGQIKSDDFNPIKPIYIDCSQHREVMLLVLNDLHIGAFGCNIDKLIRYLQQVKHIPNCYIILNGDLMNNANNLGKSSPLENALSPMNEQKIIHTLFSDPIIKSKIICSTSGNHESGARAKDSGLDALAMPMATLDLLDIYARYMAQIVLKIRCPYTRNGVSEFRILARHGSGCGGRSGKVIEEMFSALKNFGNFDMVIQGHTHKNLMSIDDRVVQNGKYSSLKKSVVPVNVPSLEEASQYAMESGYPAPNTDNSLLCIRAERNLDALDASLNEDFKVLPFKFNIDTISLDRPDLVEFAERFVKPAKELSEEKLDKIATQVATRVTARPPKPKTPKQNKTEEKEA